MSRAILESGLAAIIDAESEQGDRWWPGSEMAPIAVRRWRSFARRNRSKHPTDDERVRDLAKGLQAHFEPDIPYTPFISYEGEIYHDGARHRVTIPELRLPVCRDCGEPSFTEDADDQISAALRAHLHLLTPEEIHSAIEQLDVTFADVAGQIGVSEEQLSFWADGVQIQSRAMDNLLRIYFGFPEVRQALKEKDNTLSSSVLVK